MGLFSKKEEVPHIPEAPSLPELPKPSENHLPPLPSLPHNVVKHPVVPSSSGVKEVKHEGLPRDFHSEKPLIPSKMHEHEDKRRTLELAPSINHKMVQPDEPVFVRIDKFQTAQRNFENVKRQVKDIEHLLRKVKEKRLKEEAEISSWVENLEKVKSRLSEIDSDIFNRI